MPETGDWTPRPDPTVLTTAQLDREIDRAKEYLGGRLQVLEKLAERVITFREHDQLEKRLDDKIDLLSRRIDDLQKQLSMISESKLTFVTYDRLAQEIKNLTMDLQPLRDRQQFMGGRDFMIYALVAALVSLAIAWITHGK